MKHLIIELLKRAYFLRNLTMGDPDFSTKEFNINQRIDFLTNKMPKIKLNVSSELNSFPKSQPATGGEGRDTTHFAVVDKFGNKVAVTQSINFWFGSGFVAKKYWRSFK
jgi:gamma-glutamyltranspeptidase/glutathione hydrolase